MPELEHSIQINRQVFQSINHPRLNALLQDRFGAQGIVQILESLNPKTRSTDFKVRREAIKEAVEVLSENAESIWPNLWFAQDPDASVIRRGIRAYERISVKFKV